PLTAAVTPFMLPDIVQMRRCRQASRTRGGPANTATCKRYRQDTKAACRCRRKGARMGQRRLSREINMDQSRRGLFSKISRRELMAYGGTAPLAVSAGFDPLHAAGKTRFVFANESDYDTVDPHAAFDVGRVAVRLNVYDGLMRWEDNPAKLEPWVAESHAISPDGLTYTFKLRR